MLKKVLKVQRNLYEKHPTKEETCDPVFCTGINTVRSDGTILRPMNAFMLWAKEKRVEMMKQGLQVAEVSQVNPSQQVHLNQPTNVASGAL